LAAPLLADTPVNIAAEVQLIYKPNLSLGRVKSHLHYKVVGVRPQAISCETLRPSSRCRGGWWRRARKPGGLSQAPEVHDVEALS